MKIQDLLFPDKNICIVPEMYYHVNGDCEWKVESGSSHIILNKGAVLVGDTYFNSFSLAKWKKYTGNQSFRLRLKLYGSALVRLISKTTTKNYQLREKKIFSRKYKNIEGEIIIPITGGSVDTLIVFEITALDRVNYSGGYYEIEEKEVLFPCRIAIDICTFKRESYVKRNMKILNEYLIENNESSLFHNLYVYIQDNGQSLEKEEVESDYITVTPNRNTGGVGGFTRGMLSILRDKDHKSFTHILIMDDDAIINPYAIEKTAVFLRLLLPKYKDITVGGALFLLDTPYIQFECGAKWDTGYIVSNYNIMDMRNPYMPVRTEMEDVQNDYMGWWYCCMPVQLISENNLPLPVFIHRDDVEYGLRACTGGFVTMNGIGVWHEAFDDKVTGVTEYYDIRNDLITNAIHFPNRSALMNLKKIARRLIRNVMKLRYKYVMMNIRGIEDFLRGIDWLKEQDGVALHQEICAMNYKIFSVTKFGVTREECDKCTTDRDWKHMIAREDTKVGTIMYWYYCKLVSLWKTIRLGVTFNGLFLPGKKDMQIVEPNPGISKTYRAKKILNYTLNGMGFVTERDIRKAIDCLWRFVCAGKVFLKNYNRISMEYHNRYNEIANIEFWEKYLDEK